MRKCTCPRRSLSFVAAFVVVLWTVLYTPLAVFAFVFGRFRDGLDEVDNHIQAFAEFLKPGIEWTMLIRLLLRGCVYKGGAVEHRRRIDEGEDS